MNLHEGRSLYRMLDTKESTPAIAIPGKDNATVWRSALDWNENHHHGIFWTVNEFNSSHDRTKVNLKNVLAWTADLDTGTKAEQSKLIASFPDPSAVVESKRGFQVYYSAVDGTVENYALIETKFIVPSLNADMNARDISRILRVPNFYHWKDLSDPFFCKLVHYSDVKYTEAQIMAKFKDHRDPVKDELVAMKKLQKVLSVTGDSKLFDRIWNLDCEAALSRLSGSHAVGGETYEFKNNANGNMNIIVNGLSTACFIDRQGRIGSLDGGGPSLWNWLYWFHKDHKKVYRLIKEFFPEVVK